MAPRSTGRKKKKKGKSPRCGTCGQAIRVPKGWSMGPAVRRHYWRRHRDRMQPGRSSAR